MNQYQPNADTSEALSLFDQLVDGEITEAQNARLEELVGGDESVRKAYVERAHQHACLHWESIPITAAESRNFVENQGEYFPQVTASSSFSAPLRILMALAACLLFIGGFLSGGLLSQTHRSSDALPEAPIVAKLVDTKSCTWGEGTVSTALNAELAAGTIRLASGLAVLKFTSGAEVSLEGPAELALIDPMNCVLRGGTLLADVPPSAEGFHVETEAAVLIDLGTRFGVIVDPARNSTDVQVFDGIVDVEQRTTKKQRRLTTGTRSIIDSNHFELFDHEADEASFETEETIDPFADAIEITTARGRGREGYVTRAETRASIFERRLVVKSTDYHAAIFTSKAYVAFDLKRLRGKKVSNALFQLQILKSPRGYASFVPDATFSVYGITNQDLDQWNEESLTWENAPANGEGSSINLDDARLLGQFVIPQGEDSGFATIEGEELATFINEDVNRLVSLLIVRDTLETHRRGLAHTFARHNTLNGIAPTLRLIIENE